MKAFFLWHDNDANQTKELKRLVDEEVAINSKHGGPSHWKHNGIFDPEGREFNGVLKAFRPGTSAG